MTCIIGMIAEDGIYMGGDRCISNSSQQVTIAVPKVFIKDDYIFGICGDPRMLQLLKHKFVPPKNYESIDPYEFMCTEFIDSLRQCFVENSYEELINSKAIGGDPFIVGFEGMLFTIWCSYQVDCVVDNYVATGSGGLVAMGSLYTSNDEPEERIKKALSASEYYCPGVRAPFDIIKLMYSEEA
jgi:20S proteasome alpha/beta subunit